VLPTLFLSHGSPMMAVEDSPTGRFLDTLGARYAGARAVVVASAHDLAQSTRIGADPAPGMVYDFRGFPAQLNTIRYPAHGDPALAARIAHALGDAGLQSSVAVHHGLDHGVWVPLRRMFAQANLPLVTVSIDPRGDAAQHAALGRALSFLPGEDVLVIGSGGFTHNLGALRWDAPQAPEAAQTAAFADWFAARLAAADCSALLDWQQRAPHAAQNHPTTEHLLPLFVAWGAAGPTPRAEHLHRALEFGTLRLDAFAFHPARHPLETRDGAFDAAA
jgi:4,5-DOPA dioxygenase extradiol